MENLILSIINYKYTSLDLDRFFISLSKTGYKGHICIFAGPNSNEAYMQQLATSGVEIIHFNTTFPFVTSPHPENFASLPEPIGLFNYRHFLYYDYLLKNQSRFANVLITDIRDVVFQREPFSLLKEDALYVALENAVIGGCYSHEVWILAGYDKEVLDSLQKDRMSCAGTTIGPTHHIMRYLKSMINGMFKIKDAVTCVDQATHNVLLHRNELEPTVRMDNEDGLIMTVGMYQDPTKLRYDKQGYILGQNGERGHIIHQGDRHMSVNMQLDKFIFKNNLLTYLSRGDFRLFFLSIYFNNPTITKTWRSLKQIVKPQKV